MPATHQRRKAERPQELLDAALSLFVEKGFAATRADEVATRAGVSKGTLYLYYASKEELLKAVIAQRLSSQIAEGARQVADHQGSCADLLRNVLSTWWENVFDSDASGVFKLIITEVRNFPEIAEFYFREVVEPGQHLIGSVVQRGIDRGEFRPVPVNSVVQSLVLPMVMLCVHKHSLGACNACGVPDAMVEPRLFIRQHIDLLLGGLCATPSAAPSATSTAIPSSPQVTP
ncbi:TetR/AcrR family transcriptional regulator [Sphaerotilus sp.]|uniref:TetR/AcrR family transcriptional regulator n=1 Tax=Sphaerotilus sp. TaxID=2093942 RepID=UPI0025D97F33|nr:TetR/AcrR family transcriptional regulator [Sphaerotilus sp.]